MSDAAPAVDGRDIGVRWQEALVALGRWLKSQGYEFITPTPVTHALRMRQPPAGQPGLRDAFGWSRPFGDDLLPPELRERLADARIVVRDEEPTVACWRSRVRFSSLNDHLFAHSAYPTTHEGAVFFGPDTYRFARFVQQELTRRPLTDQARLLDIGCGSGAGGIVAATPARGALRSLVLSDINPVALRHASANASLAGVAALAVESDLFGALDGEFDMIITNPPYLVDARSRVYRNGGGPLGGELSERIVREGLDRLAPGGRMVLYTGTAVVEGHDAMKASMVELAHRRGWSLTYEEIDPDVFSEELEGPVYAHCDRIAAVGAIICRPVA